MVQPQKSVSSRLSLRPTPLVAALLCAGLLGAAPAHAATITVDSHLDTTGNAAICTLRDAIEAANTNKVAGGCAAGDPAPAVDSIHFNIPGAGVHTIVLGNALPFISEPINLNGYTQAGSATNSIPATYPDAAAIDAQPMIEIDGNGNGLIYVGPGATGSTIAGLSMGNYQSLIILAGAAKVSGNFIGMRADGVTLFPSTPGFGVHVLSTAGGSLIGGTTAVDRNLIVKTIYVSGASNVNVRRNLIGTDKNAANSVWPSGSGWDGAMISTSAGPNYISRNVIATGVARGIALLGASKTSVSENLIGVGAGGVALGNATGVEINNAATDASGNQILGNTIANSAAEGILVRDTNGVDAISGNRLDFNSIHGNVGLGINLRANGEVIGLVTPNDGNDMDSGPNGLQNFPVITSAQANAGGDIDIAFTLNSTPNGLFAISAYANPSCNASGHGEGRYHSGTQSMLATDASGNASGTFTVPAPLPVGWGVGQSVALLVRDSGTGATSEFSACATVTPAGAVNQPPLAVNDSYVTPYQTPLAVAANGVLANDSDPDGNPISSILAAGPSHGTLTPNANGGFVYTPTASYSGPDSFTYFANDGKVNSASTATVSITVGAAVNNPPVAANDVYAMPFNTTLTVAASGGVLANDSDLDGNAITAVISAIPSHGTLALNANGGFVYTPTTDYSGPDSFTYFAFDGKVNSATTATVNISVNAAIPVTSYTGPTATGAGNATASFSGGGANCSYTKSVFIALSGGIGSPPAGSAPAGSTFPFGLFDFSVRNCTPGSTITMTITYPQAIPFGTVYWKYGPTSGNVAPHWYTLPAILAGNTATFSITDGGLGDDDLTANGAIVDQGGPGGGTGAATVPIPTLSEWGMLVLAGLLALGSFVSLRRQRR